MLCNINTSTVYPCVYREHEIEQDADITLLRFIPVCTGNIYNALMNYVKSTVYPCVYRGTYVGKPFHFSFKRFIPVCTGNIFAIKFLRNEMAVYPCVYREHLADVALLNIERGLSLCVQGTYQL